MKRIITAVLLVTAAVLIGARAAEPARIRVETTRLGDDLFMLSVGGGGNIVAAAYGEGLLLVDSGYGEHLPVLREALAGLRPAPVDWVVNTHWHFDHTEGNEAFAGEGALIIGHENARRRMASGQTISIINRAVPASPPGALPALGVREFLTLHPGGKRVTILHPPGAHTDGDLVVRFEEANVVHMGDLFFNCGYPFVDLSSGGRIDGLIEAVERVLALCDDATRIVPGHGPVARRTDLETYLALLRDFRAIIAREIAAGKDLAAIQEARPTSSLDERWGRVFFSPEQFTEMVYRSLQEEGSSGRIN